MLELSGRQGTILRVVVGEYIASGVPVPSEILARRYALGVSPATIRNDMASLEEQGYIIRPYASAGGVPSDLGYRYYVGSLLNEVRISQRERRSIERYFGEVEREPDEWARLAVSLLTDRLRSIALATPPRAAVCHFRRLELVTLQESLLLLVLVLREGQIRQHLVLLEEAASGDEQAAVAAKLNDAYWGLDHAGITRRGAALQLSEIEARITGLVVGMMEAEDDRQDERYYMDGWRYLLGNVDALGSQRMLRLVEALEDRAVLTRLLGRLGSSGQMRITIGGENTDEALEGCSVILSSYGAGGRRGAIGVIGPTRMPYNRAIPMIQYVSALMSDMVQRVYA
jgi:heat-inducible transcriptional repressor